jgi:hypothetical protein
VDITHTYKAFAAENAGQRSEDWGKAFMAFIARAGEAREKEPKTWFDGDMRTHSEIVRMQEQKYRTTLDKMLPETRVRYDRMLASGQFPADVLRELVAEHKAKESQLKALVERAVG